MAENPTPDAIRAEIAKAVRARLAECRADGRDRHAAPDADPAMSWLGVKPAPAEGGTQTAAELAAYRKGYERAQVDGAPVPASAPSGRTTAVLALSASVAVAIAQALVSTPDLAVGALSGELSRAVLTVAQLVVVFAAAYRARPAS